MNKEIKALWIADLRSGKHPQGTGALCSKGRFCCLGRLCELAVEAGVCAVASLSQDAVSYDGADAILPRSVREWSELSSSTGYYGIGHSLAYDNDNGKTFTEIADIIEKEF